MTKPQSRKPMIWLLAAGVLAAAAGLWVSQQVTTRSAAELAQSLTTITLLPGGRALPKLELIDANSQPVSRESFTGHWSLVFMGFTNCGHICPMTMAEMRMIANKLTKPLKVIFISVDPNRDTPDIIRNYVQSFDPNFGGMTGTPEQIAHFASSLGAPYFVDTDPDNYIVDHSSTLFLINPDAALAGVISQPLDIAKIAKELEIVL